MEHAGHAYPAGAVCGGKLLICETKQFVCMISKISQKENIKFCRMTIIGFLSKRKIAYRKAITKSNRAHTQAA